MRGLGDSTKHVYCIDKMMKIKVCEQNRASKRNEAVNNEEREEKREQFLIINFFLLKRPARQAGQWASKSTADNIFGQVV